MPASASSPLPELGFYTLAGAPKSPRELLDEVRDAESLGLGAAFISERFNIKEACTLSGAAAAVSDDIRIIHGATIPNTLHPLVTAPYSSDELPVGKECVSTISYWVEADKLKN